MRYLITGGAGFIGSHLVDELIKRNEKVLVYDNLSTGKELFISHHFKNPKFKFVNADLFNIKKLKTSLKNIDFVFHLSAHADVKKGYTDHNIDHIQNLEATRVLLEQIYKSGVKRLAFSSTSAVYGQPKIIPTPETHPIVPTSLYGASKAASEAYIHAFASYYNLKATIFRFAPFIGERYTHGIIYDQTKKILKNPKTLEILTDGTPKRSSLYIKDGIQAILLAIKKSTKENVEFFNIGNDKFLTIDQIVNVIIKTLNYKGTKKYLGGKKGWKGDNNYLLDSTKIRSLGWSQRVSFEEGIKKTVEYLLKNEDLLNE